MPFGDKFPLRTLQNTITDINTISEKDTYQGYSRGKIQGEARQGLD